MPRSLRRVGEPAADAEDETAEPPEDVLGREQQHGERGGQPAALAQGQQADEQGRQPRQELERLRNQVWNEVAFRFSNAGACFIKIPLPGRGQQTP